MNRERVVAALRDNGALTQVEIASVTGLSAASVSNLVKELSASQAVMITPSVRNGRRAALVALNAAAGILAGIVFGDRDIRVAIASEPQEIIGERRMPLRADHAADEGVERAARLVLELLEEAGHTPSELMAGVVGIPAPIDSDSGQLGSQGVLPGWAGVDLARAFTDAIMVESAVDNTANLAALGELRFGSLQGVSNGLFITTSHGVGAGLVIGGEIYRGASGTAGEIGHVTVDPSGDICRCGNRGCLETHVGAGAILAALATSHGPLRASDVIRRARAGDPGCRRALEDAAYTLGIAVAGQANMLNPEVVVVGGLLGAAGDIVMEPLRESMRRCALPSVAASVRVAASELGMRADVAGALVSAAGLRSRMPQHAGTIAFKP